MAAPNYSDLVGGNVNAFFNSVFAEWLVIAAILIILSSIIVGIVYIVGNLLQNDKIKTWAKMEVVEIAYSVVLLGLCLSFLGVMDYTILQIVNPPGNTGTASVICTGVFSSTQYYGNVPCHIRLGMNYMNSLFSEGKLLGKNMYDSYIFTSAFAEVNINLEMITEQPGVFAYNPIRGFFVMGNSLKSTMFDYLIKIMTVTKFQEVMLRFIALALFPVMFVLGVVLRSFFFTRRLGGLLMALSLALYFIFPMFYVAGGVFFDAFSYKAKALNAAGIVPDASVFQSLYVDFEDFPSLTGNSFSMEDLHLASQQAKAGAASSIIPNDPYHLIGVEYLKSDTSASALASIDFCRIRTEEDAAALTKAQNEQDAILKKFDDFLKKKSLYQEESIFVWEAAEPGGYIDSVSRLTFFSLFFSFLGVMATIAAVKSLSGLFGGDLEIAGLTHLI